MRVVLPSDKRELALVFGVRETVRVDGVNPVTHAGALGRRDRECIGAVVGVLWNGSPCDDGFDSENDSDNPFGSKTRVAHPERKRRAMIKQ